MMPNEQDAEKDQNKTSRFFQRFSLQLPTDLPSLLSGSCRFNRMQMPNAAAQHLPATSNIVGSKVSSQIEVSSFSTFLKT
jgi:hypothetical protein